MPEINKKGVGLQEKASVRPKMPIEKRAKQFMPFAALSGLYETLEQKAWEVETRIEEKDKIWYNEGDE